jgi:hypothetical protein
MRGLRPRVSWEGVSCLCVCWDGYWSSLLCVLLLLLLITTSAASAAAATRAGLRLQLLPSCCADGFQIVVGHGCVMWCAGRGSETITCYSGTE